MLDTMKARGGSGDARALEDVHADGLNASSFATKLDFSQRVVGYRVAANLLVESVIRVGGVHG